MISMAPWHILYSTYICSGLWQGHSYTMWYTNNWNYDRPNIMFGDLQFHRRRNQGGIGDTCPPKFSVCFIYVLYYKVIYYILCPSQVFSLFHICSVLQSNLLHTVPSQSKSLSYASEFTLIQTPNSHSLVLKTVNSSVTEMKITFAGSPEQSSSLSLTRSFKLFITLNALCIWE